MNIIYKCGFQITNIRPYFNNNLIYNVISNLNLFINLKKIINYLINPIIKYITLNYFFRLSLNFKLHWSFLYTEILKTVQDK